MLAYLAILKLHTCKINGPSADCKPAGPGGSQDSQKLTDFKKRV